MILDILRYMYPLSNGCTGEVGRDLKKLQLLNSRLLPQ